MGRKRSTWNKRRKADPGMMNQERNLPPVTDYLIGDPSAFGEDVHQDLPDDEALGRNEVGMSNLPASNLNHKDVEGWNTSDPYDNASTFSPADRDRTHTPDVPIDQMNDRKIASNRQVLAGLERKAWNCTKIAEALLPGAPSSMIEDQTYELMTLPDNFVLAAVLRIAGDEEVEEVEEEVEEEKESKKKKASSKVALLRQMLAEAEEEDEDEDDKEDDKEDEEKESKKKKAGYISDAQAMSMLREMVAEMAEDEDDEKESSDHKEEDHEEEDKKEASPAPHSPLEADMDMYGEDPEIDAMLEDMMTHDSMDAAMHDEGMHSSTEFDIGMNPVMDVVAAEELAGDTTLQNLFTNTIPKEARQSAPVAQASTRTATSTGVSTLGGRVKEAADTEEDLDLSKLWKQDPDISGSF